VINNTITKDLQKAKQELGPAEQKLKDERLRLIKEKMGSAADHILLSNGGKSRLDRLFHMYSCLVQAGCLIQSDLSLTVTCL
jgi:hypothetical protein